jgi:hypothetical protein
MKFKHWLLKILKAGFRIRKYDFFVERFVKNKSGVKKYGESNEISFRDSKNFLASESRILNPKI